MNKQITMMRNGQTVIKITIFSFSFLIVFISYGQTKLDGVYSNLMPLQEHYNYYKFNQDGTFEYHSGASLGDDKYGLGTYAFSDSLLVLKFDRSPLAQMPYHKSFYWINNNDSIKVQISVKDFEGINIPEGIFIENNNPKKYGIKLDENGEGVMTLKKTNTNYQFLLNSLTFNSYKFSLYGTNNYKIIVWLNKSRTGKPIYNQTIILKILEYNEHSFKVKTNEGKIEVWKKKT